MTLSTATVTVVGFGRISVEQLRALVWKLASKNAKFQEDRRYFDGEMINFGQASNYSSDHIRIVPSRENEWFWVGSENPVTSFLVTSYLWPDNESHYSDYEHTRDTVKKYADDLRLAIRQANASGEFPDAPPVGAPIRMSSATD